ncbi:ABC-type multidrug transport system, ATPase component [Halovivax ruber XH-70]|uniref:ABC-type multidrug transport system, ATPase component n=1 Tax=Halovivax ruber (strain DSM 18193 / JCM 13892 / XH-70) TaxID=797302 RepID=L0IBH8_HALRX|nr:ABC transporter ATP-binding protein [Halovivax ruber]AGB16915.1 ABC-type multidrug transport system, ATPase component [Halovivax ruber XH-70]
MPAIETDGLTKRFGADVLAVDDLDLTVEEGEVFGFLGPNGAGKSTTINVLLDFVRPTAGNARVLGLDAQADAAAIRERIGVLPEGAELYDRLTGREHLEWIARTNGLQGTVDYEATLDRVGLTAEEAARPVGGYSKGMAQRLAFGMAILGEPDLLLLDEPSSGLDPTGMQEMRTIIREEADRGATVFFSSHILGEVEAVCDRLGIMNEGRLVATGTIDALRDELDLDASVSIEVDSVPTDRGLESVDGVRAVETDGTTLTISVDDPTKKIDAIRHIDERATVLDVRSTDTSLEQLFNTYTGNGENERDPSAAEVAGGEAAETAAEVGR